jgi:hypothetical protein
MWRQRYVGGVPGCPNDYHEVHPVLWYFETSDRFFYVWTRALPEVIGFGFGGPEKP